MTTQTKSQSAFLKTPKRCLCADNRIQGTMLSFSICFEAWVVCNLVSIFISTACMDELHDADLLCLYTQLKIYCSYCTASTGLCNELSGKTSQLDGTWSTVFDPSEGWACLCSFVSINASRLKPMHWLIHGKRNTRYFIKINYETSFPNQIQTCSIRHQRMNIISGKRDSYSANMAITWYLAKIEHGHLRNLSAKYRAMLILPLSTLPSYSRYGRVPNGESVYIKGDAGIECHTQKGSDCATTHTLYWIVLKSALLAGKHSASTS